MLDGRASLDSSTNKGNDAEWFAVNFAVSRSYGGDVQLPISTVQSTVPLMRKEKCGSSVISHNTSYFLGGQLT